MIELHLDSIAALLAEANRAYGSGEMERLRMTMGLISSVADDVWAELIKTEDRTEKETNSCRI